MNLFLGVILLLGIHVQQSVSQKVQCFSVFSLSTGNCDELLGQVEQDDCCINPDYGYVEDGVCKSCRLAQWTVWSSWSKCSVTCKEGVKQRKRACYGLGNCEDPQNSGTLQTYPCMDQNCCPVNGGWTEWGSWQPCSVTCESGIKKRQRTCSNPLPECGGSCSGKAEETAPCDTEVICPTHGGWSAWGSWGSCEATCTNEGQPPPKQLRKRTCTNPSPSQTPRGRNCEDSDTDSRPCNEQIFCSIDGNWSPWSEASPCSVTCGVGRSRQRRTCDSPKPNYGGLPCQGDSQKSTLCTNPARCPLHGIWTEWAEWGPCKPPSPRKITCNNREGTRRAERECTGRDYEGNFCDGEIVKHGSCYDIEGCKMNGVWSEWSTWSYCKPPCGQGSSQTREKVCRPDISKYKLQDITLFSGEPEFNCEPLENQSESRPCKNVPEC